MFPMGTCLMGWGVAVLGHSAHALGEALIFHCIANCMELRAVLLIQKTFSHLWETQRCSLSELLLLGCRVAWCGPCNFHVWKTNVPKLGPTLDGCCNWKILSTSSSLMRRGEALPAFLLMANVEWHSSLMTLNLLENEGCVPITETLSLLLKGYNMLFMVNAMI